MNPPVTPETALREAVEKHLTWFERFVCDEGEVSSSTPRKLARDAQDAAAELRIALAASPYAAAQPGTGGGNV